MKLLHLVAFACTASAAISVSAALKGLRSDLTKEQVESTEYQTWMRDKAQKEKKLEQPDRASTISYLIRNANKFAKVQYFS